MSRTAAVRVLDDLRASRRVATQSGFRVRVDPRVVEEDTERLEVAPAGVRRLDDGEASSSPVLFVRFAW